MVTLWRKTEKGSQNMTEEQSVAIDATVEQTEDPVDYVGSEQISTEGVPLAQEITEPILSGSTVDGSTEVQTGPDHTVITVTDEPSPTITEPAPTTQTEENTMPEDTTKPVDIAAAAQTIHDRFDAFEADFAEVELAHDDILKAILALMAERTRLLIALRDELTAENKLLAEFNAVKAGA